MEEGKLIGIDYGTKQVGIAISNTDQTVAFPKEQVKKDEALAYIKELCNKEPVAGIVLGESTDFDGKDNPVMEEIRAFESQLEDALDLPVYMEPEFLTTKEASRKQSDRADLDAAAAAVILRSFLDKQQSHE